MRLRHVFAALAAVSAFSSIAAAQEPAAEPAADPAATADAAPTSDAPAASEAAPEAAGTEGTLSADSAVPAGNGKESGIELGARLGYGFPLGDATGEDQGELSEFISGQIPLHLDFGYRLNPQLFLGGYFQYGIAFPGGDACDQDGVDCSASDVRLGIQGIYHFSPVNAGNAGWIGAGIGYEWASLTVEAGGQESDISLSGFEFLNIQGGYDFAISDQFRVGPYGMFTLGQYSSFSVNDEDVEDVEKGLHEWLFVGVKGSFGPL